MRVNLHKQESAGETRRFFVLSEKFKHYRMSEVLKISSKTSNSLLVLKE